MLIWGNLLQEFVVRRESEADEFAQRHFTIIQIDAKFILPSSVWMFSVFRSQRWCSCADLGGNNASYPCQASGIPATPPGKLNTRKAGTTQLLISSPASPSGTLSVKPRATQLPKHRLQGWHLFKLPPRYSQQAHSDTWNANRSSPQHNSCQLPGSSRRLVRELAELTTGNSTCLHPG